MLSETVRTLVVWGWRVDFSRCKPRGRPSVATLMRCRVRATASLVPQKPIAAGVTPTARGRAAALAWALGCAGVGGLRLYVGYVCNRRGRRS